MAAYPGNTSAIYILQECLRLILEGGFILIFTHYDVSIKLVSLMKIYLSETYNKVRTGKYLCDTFLIKNDPKGGDALSPLLSNCALEYATIKIGVM